MADFLRNRCGSPLFSVDHIRAMNFRCWGETLSNPDFRLRQRIQDHIRAREDTRPTRFTIPVDRFLCPFIPLKTEENRIDATLSRSVSTVCKIGFLEEPGEDGELDAALRINSRPNLPLDPVWFVTHGKSVRFVGAYWFRPERHVRGGMPRMVRWPRKSPDQKTTANQELALAA